MHLYIYQWFTYMGNSFIINTGNMSVFVVVTYRSGREGGGLGIYTDRCTCISVNGSPTGFPLNWWYKIPCIFSRLFPSKSNEIPCLFGFESVFVLIM